MTPADFSIFAQSVQREDIANSLRCIHEHLLAQGIEHFMVKDDTSPNPHLFALSSIVDERPRLSFVGWNETEGKIEFLGYDLAAERYKTMEGFSEEEAMTFIDLEHTMGVVEWLNGDFHRILASARAKLMAGAKMP